MNDYATFRQAILERTERCGAGKSPGRKHRQRCEAVIAATAKVVAEKGIGWFEIASSDQKVDAVMSQLGVLARVVSWLLAIFIPGGPIWLAVIEWSLPIIADYLTSVEAAALCGSSGEDLGRQAEEYLRGLGQ